MKTADRVSGIMVSVATMLLTMGMTDLVQSAPPVVPSVNAPGHAADAAGADELAGLWKARQWTGPIARGPLVIQRTGASYTADIVGKAMPLHLNRDELCFDLPNEQGGFRGKLVQGGDFLGHWYPRGGSRQATPVRLTPDGPHRWRGEVHPWDDVFTFYLMIQPRPDGTLGAFLHNPERGFGGYVDRAVRDGAAVSLMGTRPGQQAETEWARGTYDRDRDVITLVFPTRGGSYDFHREGDDSDFYSRGRNPPPYEYRPPLARDDGWPTGTLEEALIDRPAMERFIQMIIDTPMDSARTPLVEGILISRHGKLVLEEYFHGEHRDKLHETRSATKSVTAVVVGAAIAAGEPLALSTPVYQIMSGGAFPEGLDPLKRAMTVEHLLTMSSGWFCDDTNPEAPGNEDAMWEQTEEPDLYALTLRVPMATPPGEKAVYCSCNPNLALGVVGRATGEDPMYVFDRLVAKPMKIDRYAWVMDQANQPYGGGALKLLPRDFMKFGQLMLNAGTWEGRRILDQDFAERATARLYHLRGIYYGYLWWSVDFPYKERTVRSFSAGGLGGQSITVVPELGLVVAIYGANYAYPRTALKMEYPARYILPAVREPGDDMNASVMPREFVSPYGPSPVGGPVREGK